jgi:N-methylhydantoinase B
MVESDVINQYVSLEKAREDYGVVINPETMKLDLEATQRLRDSMKGR